MQKRPEHEPEPPLSFNSEALASLFQAEHKPSHNQKWSRLRADVAREALIKAEQLRASGIDAGDAYLQGIADLNYRLTHEQLLVEVRKRFEADFELDTKSDNP